MADALTLHWNIEGGDSNTARQQQAAFEALLGNARLAPARRPVPAAPGEPEAGLAAREVPLWRLDAAALEALRELLPDGLFGYDPGQAAAVEDPVFFRQGKLFWAVYSRAGEVRCHLHAWEILELELQGVRHQSLGPVEPDPA